jgi:hypothetical protein
MPDQTTVPVDPTKISVINDLVTQLGLLLSELLNAARNTADATQLIQINNDMLSVQTILYQSVQAQATTNDALFGQVTLGLKTQSNMLTGLRAQAATVVADVASVGKIIGYIGEAISLIGKL